MADPKKRNQIVPADNTPSALPTSPEVVELTDSELDSVIGGATVVGSGAIDTYAAIDNSAN